MVRVLGRSFWDNRFGIEPAPEPSISAFACGSPGSVAKKS